MAKASICFDRDEPKSLLVVFRRRAQMVPDISKQQLLSSPRWSCCSVAWWPSSFTWCCHSAACSALHNASWHLVYLSLLMSILSLYFVYFQVQRPRIVVKQRAVPLLSPSIAQVLGSQCQKAYVAVSKTTPASFGPAANPWTQTNEIVGPWVLLPLVWAPCLQSLCLAQNH